MKVNYDLDFDLFLVEMAVALMGIFSNQADLPIIFYEFILSNNSSFEPQHYLDDFYIHIFTLIYALEL